MFVEGTMDSIIINMAKMMVFIAEQNKNYMFRPISAIIRQTNPPPGTEAPKKKEKMPE